MRGLFTLLVLTIVAFSCQKDNDDNLTTTCNVSNPIEDLAWLKEQIQELEKTSLYESGETYILQAEHDGDIIFILGNCSALCNSVSSVYNCEGEIMGYIGDDNFDFSLIENSPVIWKPESSICF